MAYHKKNLLEAFQASAAAEKAKAQGAPSKEAPKAGGPFARPSDPGPADDPAALGEALPSARAAWRPDGLQRMIALQVLITIAAFFLGRASVSRVDASEAPGGESRAGVAQPAEPGTEDPIGTQQAIQTQQGGAGHQPSSLAAEVDSRPGTAAERALLDSRNRYTVKLAEYRKGKDDAVALSTLQWLLDQELPAVAQVQGGRLFLLLGAAETQAELDELLVTAKTMTGPPPLNKPAEFHDAYVVGIDRLGIR